MGHNAYDKLVRAAAELMEEIDLDRISVRMICDRAGVRLQTFYYHFRSVGDLLGSVIKAEVYRALETCANYHVWEEGFRAKPETRAAWVCSWDWQPCRQSSPWACCGSSAGESTAHNRGNKRAVDCQ